MEAKKTQENVFQRKDELLREATSLLMKSSAKILKNGKGSAYA